jgi:hypothetical protein
MKRKADLAWIIPATITLFLTAKSRIICLLLADSLLLLNVFGQSQTKEKKLGTICPQLSVLALLIVGIVPATPELSEVALVIYLFIRLAGFPFGKVQENDHATQVYELFFPMFVWSLVGSNITQPLGYFAAGAFFITSIFSSLSKEPKRAFLSAVVATQMLGGFWGGANAVIAGLVLAGPIAQCLVLILSFIYVVVHASSLPEPFSWVFMAGFSVLAGLSRGGFELPQFSKVKEKKNVVHNLKIIFAVAASVAVIHFSGMFSTIDPMLLSMAALPLGVEAIRRKFITKGANAFFDLAKTKLFSRAEKLMARDRQFLRPQSVISFNFKEVQTPKFPQWIDVETFPIMIAIALVWGLWIWLY